MKVGDRVKTNDTYFSGVYNNLIGKVICISQDSVGVDFGVENIGHNLTGRITTKSGWYISKEYLDIVDAHICGLVCKCNPRESMLL